MNAGDAGKWADYLFEAERRNEAVAPISDIEPTLTVEAAYDIQDELVARRIAAGERIVGAKLGLTSRAKQEDMGIAEPVYAFLTDAMLVPRRPPCGWAMQSTHGSNRRSSSLWATSSPDRVWGSTTFWRPPRLSVAAWKLSTVATSTSASGWPTW